MGAEREGTLLRTVREVERKVPLLRFGLNHSGNDAPGQQGTGDQKA
jgi:hypothetical protein